MTAGAEELTSGMDDDEGALWAHGHEWAEACSICFANRYACTLCVRFMIGSRTRRLCDLAVQMRLQPPGMHGPVLPPMHQKVCGGTGCGLRHAHSYTI
jgi:hypothetical protein